MARVRWRYWMEKAKETMAFYQREFGIRPLIRMVFYNLTKFDPGLPNTEYHNKYFDWLLVKARQTREIPWDAFAEDAERWPAGGDEPYLTVDQAIALGLDYFRDLPSSYRLLFWWGQDNQVVVMAEKTGERAGIVLADGGYHTAANLEAGKRRGQLLVMGERYQGTVQDRYFKDRFVYDGMTDSYLCPHGQRPPFRGFRRSRHASPGPIRLCRASRTVCRSCPAFGICTRDGHAGRALWIGPQDALLRRHREWMTTDEARALYARRKELSEPTFGILKEQLGARRFLLRGLANVWAEFILLAMTSNLRTLWRVRTRIQELAPTWLTRQPLLAPFLTI